MLTNLPRRTFFRFFAHLLVRLLVVTSLPSSIQPYTALLPVSMLWSFVRHTSSEADGVRTIEYDYYGNGALKSVGVALGGRTDYAYDGQGRLKTVTTSAGGLNEQQVEYGYYSDGLVESRAHLGGYKTTYGYDNAGRVTSIDNQSAGVPPPSYRYTYYPDGSRKQQTEIFSDNNEVTDYTYDAQSRLATVSYPEAKTITYGYDAAGNRTAETVKVGGNKTFDRYAVFDAANRMTGRVDTAVGSPSIGYTLGWDNNGNLTSVTHGTETKRYLYDPRDLMIEAQIEKQVLKSDGTTTVEYSTPGRYQYDWQDLRIVKHGAPGIRQYIYDGTDPLVELDASGNDVARFDYADGDLLSRIGGHEQRFFTHDALGSITGVANDSGVGVARYRLDAWGNLRFPEDLTPADPFAAQNRALYTGHIWDEETELYYAKARYLDPTLGRFITQDSFPGFQEEPASLNPYIYAYNNPLTYVDPTGRFNIVGRYANTEAGWWANFATNAWWAGEKQGFRIMSAIPMFIPRMATEGVGVGHDVYSLTVGPDAPMWSSAGRTAVEGMKAGDSELKATLTMAGGTAFAIGTFGMGPGIVEEYGAFYDYATGNASIDELETRTAEGAGGQLLGVTFAALAFSNTRWGWRGPEISFKGLTGGLREIPDPAPNWIRVGEGQQTWTSPKGDVFTDAAAYRSYMRAQHAASRAVAAPKSVATPTEWAPELAAKYEAYRGRGGKLSPARFAANQVRSPRSSARVLAYKEKFGWKRHEFPVDVEGVERRLDLADPFKRKGLELKSGDSWFSLSKELQWEILRDEILRTDLGWDIRWHFEGPGPNVPLARALDQAGIPYSMGGIEGYMPW